jgi:hypothetical protein
MAYLVTLLAPQSSVGAAASPFFFSVSFLRFPASSAHTLLAVGHFPFSTEHAHSQVSVRKRRVEHNVNVLVY